VVAPMAWFPFAGAKDSFFGDLRAQGFEALKFFTQEKVISSDFTAARKSSGIKREPTIFSLYGNSD